MHQEKEIVHKNAKWSKILNTFLFLPYVVANVKLTTVKDYCLFIIVQCVSENYETKIEVLRSQYQTFFANFRVLTNLHGSPPYFERCKKDLFAMIRQLGNPTWFCSFSAAETRWIHLIKILGHLIDNKDYTDDEVRQMSWQRKSELIHKDPVT